MTDPTTELVRLDTEPPTTLERVGLFFGLGIGIFGAVLPGLILCWLALMILVWILIAELLQRTDGLFLSVFETATHIAWTGTILSLIIGVILVVLRKKRPFSFIYWIHLVALLLTSRLIRRDLGGIDVKDTLTSALLLFLGTSTTVILPLVVIMLIISLSLAFWTRSTRTWISARRIARASATVGAVGIIALTGFNKIIPDWNTLEDDDLTFREVLIETSEEIPGGPEKGYFSSATGPISTNLFAECAEELAKSKPGKLSSIRGLQNSLKSKGISSDDAYDTALDALLKVCEKYARGDKIDDLTPYYFKAARNGLIDAVERIARRRKKHAEWGDIQPRPGGRVPNFGEAVFRRLHKAKASLKPEDQNLLSMRYQAGMSFKAIGQKIGKRESTARKRVQRSRDRLRSHYNRLKNMN